ncbi:DNA repair protein rad52 [Mycoemilia scoparia]|uniref:DNA repair protein rad52 n=1 Tax=Mycoemilia scoparia TaxID=417184 RepID=A0A9W7ZXN6_9FUNG|nr:DNA repair protein rad52 [Mycoemilia scoparia]
MLSDQTYQSQNPLPQNGATQTNGFVSANSREYTYEEFDTLQTELKKQLGPENINTRSGPGGSRLSYIEGCKVINLANELFGFNGWSSQIQNMTVDFLDYENGTYNIGVSCVVRVTLRDGTFHEDVGYGMIEKVKSKAQGLEKSRKEAATDALKRAFRGFGNAMGNCLYNKNYLKIVGKYKKEMASITISPVITEQDIYRSSRVKGIHRKGYRYQADSTPSSTSTSNKSNQSTGNAKKKDSEAGYKGKAEIDDEIESIQDDLELDDFMDDLEFEDPDVGRPIISESPNVTQLQNQNHKDGSSAQYGSSVASTPQRPPVPNYAQNTPTNTVRFGGGPCSNVGMTPGSGNRSMATPATPTAGNNANSSGNNQGSARALKFSDSTPTARMRGNSNVSVHSTPNSRGSNASHSNKPQHPASSPGQRSFADAVPINTSRNNGSLTRRNSTPGVDEEGNIVDVQMKRQKT